MEAYRKIEDRLEILVGSFYDDLPVCGATGSKAEVLPLLALAFTASALPVRIKKYFMKITAGESKYGQLHE